MRVRIKRTFPFGAGKSKMPALTILRRYQRDGTENQKDNLQGNEPGQPSSEDTQGTSQEGDARTITEQERKEIIGEAVSDALSKAGREHKAETDALKEHIAELERQQDAAELEEAKGDPVKMRAYQDKQAEKKRAKSLDERERTIAKREQEQDRKEAEHAETVRAAQEVTLGMKLYEVAARYELNPEDLKKDMKNLNLTTEQQLEALAKRLKPTGERPPKGEIEGEKKTTIPVAVPTSGGAKSGTPTLSDYFRDKNK